MKGWQWKFLAKKGDSRSLCPLTSFSSWWQSRMWWARGESMEMESVPSKHSGWAWKQSACLEPVWSWNKKRSDGVSTAVYPKDVSQPWAGLVPWASVARRSRERKTCCVEPEHSFLTPKYFFLVHGCSDRAKPLHTKLFGSKFWTTPRISTTEAVRRHTATKAELLL